MSDAYTSNSLIESVIRKCHVPNAQTTFLPQDFLDFGTEELRLGICPDIMAVHEDYFLFSEDIPLVMNKQKYEIPSRAMGGKLRDVQYKLGDNKYIEMTRIGIGDRFSNTSVSTNLRRFYIENNKVVLMDLNSNSAPAWLTMVYYIKPSKLVPDEQVGIISSVNRISGEISLSNIPTKFLTQVKYDLYKGDSPFNILKINFNILGINSLTKTIKVDPASLPEDLTAGDHLSLSGECAIPQIPSELHPMLAQMISCRVLEAQSDTEGLANANAKLREMKIAAGILVDNRVEDAPQKIVNRFSLLKSIAFSRYRNR